ncbi:DNA-binding protein inhibitor ID-3 [Brachionichthys hirsutus]|uniref:DNA-binding protein inhibitor ID-3 n=1 Tax=Brachionichthys hirsutus TaxID=412623 RepID=UPI0036046CF7
MKAISPVRSARSCCYKAVCCVSEQSLSISRSKHACPEEPASGALCDMNDCYSKLKELVPSIPRGESVSQVEILQHVIDYIFDLQIALEAEDSAASEVVLSIKAADLARNFSKEEGRLCH